MINTQVTSGGAKSVLTGAILLYSGKRGFTSEVDADFATVHSVNEIAGVPQIMPGRPLTGRHLATLHKELSSAHAMQSIAWLDPRLLAKGPDRMVWATPPEKRPLFFKQSSFVKDTFDGSAVCPLPGLVWIAINGVGLYVFAVADAQRPTQATQLYQAPFFNVWGRGLVCVGNATLPQATQAWEPDAWERFFFESHFTHANFLEKDRLVKGMHPVKFWKSMVQAPPDTFPLERLVAMPLTVQDLLDPLMVDKLNKLPRPKGEF